jgi:hypothetical protein
MPLVLVLPSTVSSWWRPYAPHAAGLPEQQPVGGLIGTGGEFLAGIAVEVVAQPGLAQLICIGMQAVLRTGEGPPGLGKERAPSRILFGQGASPVEGLGLADEADAPFGFP